MKSVRDCKAAGDKRQCCVAAGSLQVEGVAPSNNGFLLVGLLSLILIEAGARVGDCLFL